MSFLFFFCLCVRVAMLCKRSVVVLTAGTPVGALHNGRSQRRSGHGEAGGQPGGEHPGDARMRPADRALELETSSPSTTSTSPSSSTSTSSSSSSSSTPSSSCSVLPRTTTTRTTRTRRRRSAGSQAQETRRARGTPEARPAPAAAAAQKQRGVRGADAGSAAPGQPGPPSTPGGAEPPARDVPQEEARGLHPEPPDLQVQPQGLPAAAAVPGPRGDRDERARSTTRVTLALCKCGFLPDSHDKPSASSWQRCCFNCKVFCIFQYV